MRPQSGSEPTLVVIREKSVSVSDTTVRLNPDYSPAPIRAAGRVHINPKRQRGTYSCQSSLALRVSVAIE